MFECTCFILIMNRYGNHMVHIIRDLMNSNKFIIEASVLHSYLTQLKQNFSIEAEEETWAALKPAVT